MGFRNVEFPYNEHKLKALQKALESRDREYTPELVIALDSLYEETVSSSEKQKVNERIDADNKKDELNSGSISIVHLHGSDDDIYFMARNANTLYDLINLYNSQLSLMAAQNYSVDSMMSAFDDYCCIDEYVFNAIFSVLLNNDVFSQEAHFEFDVYTLEFRNKEHPDMFGFDLNEIEDVFKKTHDDTKAECDNEAEFNECVDNLYYCNEGLNMTM